MPTRATVVLKDRASTPVNHNFIPFGEDANGVHIFKEKGDVPAGEKRLTISTKQVGKKVRVKALITCPVVATETVNGISNPVIIRTNRISVEADYDALSPEQERKDIVGFAADVLSASQTVLNPVWTQNENIYG